MRAIETATREILLPRLASLSQEARARMGLTVDAPGDDAAALIEAMRKRIQTLVPPEWEEAEARKMASTIENTNRQLLRDQFRSMFGIDLFQDSGVTRELVQSFTRQNVQLITSLREQHLERVQQTVERGFRSGERASSIAKTIQEDFGVSKNRAKLIARDQVSKLNGELTRSRQVANGITQFRWRTVRDDRVRDEHADLEGEVFSWDDPPEEGIPGEAVNCRCFAEPVLTIGTGE